MFKNLIKGLQAGLAITLLNRYRHVSVQMLKIEAAKYYLHGVRMARLSVIGLVRLGIVIGLICVGVVILHAGLFILLPGSVKAKALFGMILGFGYVVGGCLALRAVMDETAWMQKSGIADILKETNSQLNGE